MVLNLPPVEAEIQNASLILRLKSYSSVYCNRRFVFTVEWAASFQGEMFCFMLSCLESLHWKAWNSLRRGEGYVGSFGLPQPHRHPIAYILRGLRLCEEAKTSEKRPSMLSIEEPPSFSAHRNMARKDRMSSLNIKKRFNRKRIKIGAIGCWDGVGNELLHAWSVQRKTLSLGLRMAKQGVPHIVGRCRRKQKEGLMGRLEFLWNFRV